MNIDKFAHGQFCWVDLATTDQAGAKAFYEQLFGWQSVDEPLGGGYTYTTFELGGRAVGGGSEQMPEQKGAPPAWSAHVCVENADAVIARAVELGAKVLAPAMDVMEHGRLAVLQDPGGAVFALWQPRKNPGMGVLAESGSVCWVELATRELDAMAKFYGEVFGWQTTPSKNSAARYLEATPGGVEFPTAGMLEMNEKWEGLPSHWMVYFAVDDCDAMAAKAQELGGKVHVPPTDLPKVGRFSVLADPQGAVFSIIKMTMQKDG